MLAVASLLWASSAFAAENAPSPGKVTITVGGKTLATLWMDDEPTDAKWSFDCADSLFNATKRFYIGKGKCTVKVFNDERTFMEMTMDDAVVEVDYKALPDKT